MIIEPITFDQSSIHRTNSQRYVLSSQHFIKAVYFHLVYVSNSTKILYKQGGNESHNDGVKTYLPFQKCIIFLERKLAKWQPSTPLKSNMHKSRPFPSRYYVNRSDLWSRLRDFLEGEYRKVNTIERNSKGDATHSFFNGAFFWQVLFHFYCVASSP